MQTQTPLHHGGLMTPHLILSIKLSLRPSHPWLRTKQKTNPVSQCPSSMIRTFSDAFISCLWDRRRTDGPLCPVNITLPIYFSFSKPVSFTSRFHQIQGLDVIMQKMLSQWRKDLIGSSYLFCCLCLVMLLDNI